MKKISAIITQLIIFHSLFISKIYSTIITKAIQSDYKPAICIQSQSDVRPKVGYLLNDLLDNPPSLSYKAFSISIWYKAVIRSSDYQNIFGLSENWTIPLRDSRALLTLWNIPYLEKFFFESYVMAIGDMQSINITPDFNSFMGIWWKAIIVYQPLSKRAFCKISNFDNSKSQSFMMDYSAFVPYLIHYTSTSGTVINNFAWLNIDHGQHNYLTFNSCSKQKYAMFHYSNDEEFSIETIQNFYFDSYKLQGYTPYYYLPLKTNKNSLITQQNQVPQKFKNIYLLNFNEATNGQTINIEQSDITFKDYDTTSYVANFKPGTFVTFSINQSYQLLVSFILNYDIITNGLVLFELGSNFVVNAAINGSSQKKLQIILSGVTQSFQWDLGASGSRHTLVIKIGQLLSTTQIFYFVDNGFISSNTFSFKLNPTSFIQIGTSNVTPDPSLDNFQIKDFYIFPNADAKQGSDFVDESGFVLNNCLLYAQFSFNSAYCLICATNYKYNYDGTCSLLQGGELPNQLTQFTNLFEGSSALSIVDSEINPGIQQLTYKYKRSDNNFDFIILGYFKLESWQPSQLLTTLAYLYVDQTSKYYFLHLYLESETKITLKMTLDSTNSICYTSFIFSTSILNTWQFLGFGYRNSDKLAYLSYQDPFLKITQTFQSVSCSGNSVGGPTNSFTVCLGCKIPNANKYSQFVGKIKQVKLIEGFNGYNQFTKYSYINTDGMVRIASDINYFNVNTLVDIYSLGFSGLSFSCSAGYYFFEGVCVVICSTIGRTQSDLGKYNSLFSNASTNSCEMCPPNCLTCGSKTFCTSCRVGYILDSNNLCVPCSQSDYYDTDSKTCLSTCPSITDLMNRICVTSVNLLTHSSLISLELQYLENNDGVQLLGPGDIVQPDSFIKCSIDASYSFFMFFGGEQVASNYSIKKSWSNLPKNYYKIVTFNVVIYGSASISDLIVSLNGQISSFTKQKILKSDAGICTSSVSNQPQIILSVQFEIMDNSNSLDLVIKNSKIGIAVRNIQLTVKKCHPTCESCLNGPNPWNCTSCQVKRNIVVDNLQCVCEQDEYYKLQSCYSSPCYDCVQCALPNCLRCEDETGLCLKCSNGYSILNGACVLDCTAGSPLFSQHLASQFCYQSKVLAFEHFQNNMIFSDLEFWQQSTDYLGLGGTLLTCLGSQLFLPNLGRISGTTNQYNTLRTSIDSFMTKYQGLYFDMSLLIIDKMDLNNDYIIFEMSGIEVSRATFGYEPSLASTCVNLSYGELLKDFQFSVFKGDGDIDLKILSQFDEDRTIVSFSLKNFKAYLIMNEPLCISYTYGPNYSSATCSACGSNATLDNITNQCTCDIGYYLFFDVSIQEFVCKLCNPVCASCTGPTVYDCVTCTQGYYKINGYCQLCETSINSLCGGSQVTHTNCINNGWAVLNPTTCVFCSNYVNGKCGGDQPTLGTTDACYQAGYYNYNSNQCASCQFAAGSDCGRSEIKTICYQKNWDQYSPTSCMNCNPDSLTLNQCHCHSSCSTCSRFFNSKDCLDCQSSKYFFNGQCLEKCPNGYRIEGKNCVACSDPEMPNCFSCYSTCSVCNPFEISNLPNKCTQCSQTRQLSSGECICKDPEDSRQIFFECSYQDIAVIQPVLSNSTPQLTIEFGKLLNPPAGQMLNTPSPGLCQILIQPQTLQRLGVNYSCSITLTKIIVTFGQDGIIIEGDLVHLNPNLLSFQTSPSILISKYYNLIVVQEKVIGQSKMLFDMPTGNINSCDDFEIKFKQYVNNGGRGFYQITWSIESYTPSSQQQETLLNNLLAKLNSNQSLDIYVSKGIILAGFSVVIRIDYTLKINVKSFELFTINMIAQKKIFFDIKQSFIFPLYKYQSGIAVIEFSILQCNPEGDLKTTEPINLSITSLEHPDFDFSESNYLNSEYPINITPFKLPTQQITLKINASLVSSGFINSKTDYVLDVQRSKLFIKIISGNGQFSYKTKIIMKGRVRDNDLPTETEPQGIDLSWTCIDPATSNTCMSKLGQQVTFPSNQQTAEIKSNTFNPYTVIKVELQGTKDTRVSNDSVLILICELDLPPLDLQIYLIDKEVKTVNINEEIYVELNYSSQTSLNYLAFSGTIIYQDEVVGIIKFDYFTLRFQIWNYYSNFKRTDSQISIRFSIFNPTYQMPSTSLLNLNINFPPENCIFTITQSDTFGYSLETKYLLTMEKCVDTDLPISYQFFYYTSQSDLDFEIKYPLQVKRRQITDKQYRFNVVSSLPAGQLIVMAQAIDSKSAIFNITKTVTVQTKVYNEASYIGLIQQDLSQIQSIPPTTAIFQLAIISEDILIRNQFTTSTAFSQQKINIQNTLYTLSKQLPTMSTFGTLADKAIASLSQSGILYDSTQSLNILNNIITSLDGASTLQSNNLELSKEKLKQKLFDSFQFLDALANSQKTPTTVISDQNTQNKLIELHDKIGKYLFVNILPNEDAIIFKGASTRLIGNQVTEKYICIYFICDMSADGKLRRALQVRELSSSGSDIFNIKLLQTNENLYSNDLTYKNYTEWLKKQDSSLTVSQYPIITPSITDQNNQGLPSFQRNAALYYNVKTQSNNHAKMGCLTKSPTKGWTQQGCKNVFNSQTQKYMCICENLNPTTVIEDLESLFANSNLSTAFGSDGISNLSNFTNFYEYVIFWILLSSTAGFIFLYYKGKSLDQIEKEKYPHLIDKIQIFPSNEVNPIVQQNQDLENSNLRENKKQNEKQVIINDLEDIEGKSSKEIDIISHQQSKKNNDSIESIKLEDLFNIQTSQDQQQQQLQKQRNSLIKVQGESQTQSALVFNSGQQQRINSQQNQHDSPIGSYPRQPVSQTSHEELMKSKFNLMKNNDEKDLFGDAEENQDNNNIILTQNINAEKIKNQDENNIKDNNKQDIALQETNTVLQSNQQNQARNNPRFEYIYRKLAQLKSILIFHDFFQIFFIFNPEIARSFRFVIIYIRTIHSLAISVVFDQQYSIVQKIAVAIINAVVLIIVVKILDKFFSLKSKTGILINRFAILALICGYYYIILSISSGQSSSKSNQSISTFALIYMTDFFIISTISAALQLYFAKLILKKQELQNNGCWNIISKSIKLQLILQQLK